MERLESIYQFNKQLFEKNNIAFKQWQHEPIHDFATDEKVAKELGLTGTMSKSLFLKLKGGGFALLLTEKDKRLDRHAVKAVLGKRVSICSPEEMTEEIGCLPGAVCPIGLPEHVQIVVDQEMINKTEILYTPGYPDRTIGFSGNDLPRLLDQLPNVVYLI
ncbi:YbaK/EbsC family protein [Vibrio sp. VB16]|uniref:YbaK/EbsC family protein n=1 Tax=Vibrio sp. VB16 TaxID=2785746 RepID=UPI0018A10FE9|nr:YbaK/EbsC family protein [Vibrio sp. VB16]UGA53820.1 YbaK/EbsC family protein [Vibrio sp. VB16]